MSVKNNNAGWNSIPAVPAIGHQDAHRPRCHSAEARFASRKQKGQGEMLSVTRNLHRIQLVDIPGRGLPAVDQTGRNVVGFDKCARDNTSSRHTWPRAARRSASISFCNGSRSLWALFRAPCFALTSSPLLATSALICIQVKNNL